MHIQLQLEKKRENEKASKYEMSFRDTFWKIYSCNSTISLLVSINESRAIRLHGDSAQTLQCPKTRVFRWPCAREPIVR